MMDNNKTPTDTAQILHGLGQLTGQVSALNQGLTARIEDIRQDIRRIEESQTERLDHVENNLTSQISQLREDMGKRIEAVDKRLDGMSTRVTALEAEDKRLIEKIAKLSALGGGIGGMLAAGIVEIIKRF